MRINKNGEAQKAIFIELPSKQHTELSKYAKDKNLTKKQAILQALAALYGKGQPND